MALNQGQFAPHPRQGIFGNVWSHFGVPAEVATDIQWVEARNTANLLQCTGQPHSKDDLASSITSAEVEKPWPRQQQALCCKKREEKRGAKVWFSGEKSKGFSLERKRESGL